MSDPFLPGALAAFQRAAERVPAYRILLKEAGIEPATVSDEASFLKLPILEKRSTFQRFPLAELCVDGEIGQPATVLTSSGHSGIFAFGLTSRQALAPGAQAIDDLLDHLFAVRSTRTLLINALPMGVRIPTQACTLADTSVRPDMIIGLVRAFASHYEQLILVGETAFLKLCLELGVDAGIPWASHRVHLIVGEEPLAENARRYLEAKLGTDSRDPGRGMVASSMGVAELGLNLFFEAPPRTDLIALRRVLHEDAELRTRILGPRDWVPSLFTYDPRRIRVEFDRDRRLVITTLDPTLPVPLIRYAPGDVGQWVDIPADVLASLRGPGLEPAHLAAIPIVAIEGRGESAKAGAAAVFPEAVKEGIYHDAALARLITANFRLVAGPERARIRIQLAPGVAEDAGIDRRFAAALTPYVRAPFAVSCERYETFRSGMLLDYERKFAYLKS